VNNLFGLTPLADLPDEAAARLAGQAAGFNTAGVTQTNLGPHDGVVNATPGTGSLLSAFDPARLMGTAPVLPASYAMIDPTTVATMPHFAGAGCTALGITPLDTQLGVTTTVPSDFFARPSRTPN
jgi:phospholipase C